MGGELLGWLDFENEYEDYKFPNRLKLKNSSSPNSIERLFFEVFRLFGYPKQKPYQVENNKLSALVEDIEENEKKLIFEKIRNSMLCSFEFNQINNNKYKYYLSDAIIDRAKKYPSSFASQYQVVNFLNLEDLKEVRNLFLYLQNKNLLTNFTENRLAHILHYNFQTLNNNYGNSVANNQKQIRDSQKKSTNKHSLYYVEFKTIKKSMITPYL